MLLYFTKFQKPVVLLQVFKICDIHLQVTSLAAAKQSLLSAQKYLGLAKDTIELGLQPDNDGIVWTVHVQFAHSWVL
jgi:hypothetical protein